MSAATRIENIKTQTERPFLLTGVPIYTAGEVITELEHVDYVWKSSGGPVGAASFEVLPVNGQAWFTGWTCAYCYHTHRSEECACAWDSCSECLNAEYGEDDDDFDYLNNDDEVYEFVENDANWAD